MVFQALRYYDHKAQIVGELQLPHLEMERCTFSVSLPQAPTLCAPGLSFIL
jgi:hypothetical protein